MAIVSFQVVKDYRDWHCFRVQLQLKVAFVVCGPAVFPRHVVVVFHRVFEVCNKQRVCTQQACFLSVGDQLVNCVFWLSFSWRSCDFIAAKQYLLWLWPQYFPVSGAYTEMESRNKSLNRLLLQMWQSVAFLCFFQAS